MSYKDELLRLKEDLTHLEINTILKPSIIARKMPPPRHALIDIAQTYCQALHELAGQTVPEDPSCNVGTFEAIRKTAVAELETHDRQLHTTPPTTEAEQTAAERKELLLWRIRRNCDHLKGILANLARAHPDTDIQTPFTRTKIEEDHLGSLPLKLDDRVHLRKIWETGMEEIVMQTIVQLDGDVLTRVQPRIANQEHSVLHGLHRDETRLALQMWETLIKTATSFFSSIVKGIKT